MAKQLFALDGRASRETYWVMTLVMGGLSLWNQSTESVIPAILILACLWPTIAVSVKRWHDRNKSGWWVFINLIPVVGAIWALIEQGFLKGTPGRNDYGEDPLAD